MEPNESDNKSTVVVNGKPVSSGSKSKFSLRKLTAWASNKKRLAIIGAAAAVVLVIAGVLTWVLLSDRGINAEAPVATVSIDADGFNPGTIKIEKGQEVAWVNNNEDAHQVYALQEDVPGLDSVDLLANGDTYIFTFEDAGTFNYYDPLNPEQYRGTVIVEE